MPMLTRYRKAGGFTQLVSLLEACNPEKQTHLLELIGEEDPGWAVLASKKLLTPKKVFSWPEEVLAEVLLAMPSKIAAFACHQTDEITAHRAIRSLNHRQAQEMMEHYQSYTPTINERHAACVKMLRTVRDLERDGKIRLNTERPDQEIDERLIS